MMRLHNVPLVASVFAALSLVSACQSPQPLQPAQGPRALSAQTASSDRLALSPALLKELNAPDEEDALPDARSGYSDALAQQTVGSYYEKAHSYYFNVLDEGRSSVETILQHDGHSEAARLIKHWSKHLGENAVWPDAQSTTYKGRWPALEHAELKGGDGWFMYRSAGAKAEEYYQRALGTWKQGLPADHPDQAEAWGWLGRASHLLQDATVPFHTVSLLRPAQLRWHSAYEKTCDELFWNYLPSRNHNPGGVWANGPYPAQGAWGLYFAPGMGMRAMVRQNADYARLFYKLVNEREDWTTRNWDRTRAIMIPLAAKTTAGLTVSFLREVKATK